MQFKDRVRRQFDRQAKHYTVSRVHQGGPSLDRVVELAEPEPHDLALDVATGAGFTACAVAPFVRRVIASDIAAAMLRETRALARQRGLSHLVTQYADAEHLPFKEGSFDLVTCRTAPHHFPDAPAFLREVRRILKPGGRLVVSDTCSPEQEETEAWMHRFELLRDPTHVCNYRPSVWQRMTAQAGLTWEYGDTDLKQSMDFTEWVTRSGTDPETVATLRRMLETAPDAVREAFLVEYEDAAIRFAWPYVIFRARKR
jgi:ubiquinone/menaquinone biosynthesis C-methylase UbiE